MSAMDRVRRVVMGGATPEQSVFTNVEEVHPFAHGDGRAWFIAGWDGPRHLPHLEEGAYSPRSWFPSPSGVRVTAIEFFNGGESDGDEEVGEYFDRLLAAESAGQRWDESREGMHSSSTIDFGVVVAGEVVIEAGDGASETLGPGDVYVQYGALHRWKPAPGSAKAHVVFVCLGAESSPPPG